jgi:hypothetical protein
MLNQNLSTGLAAKLDYKDLWRRMGTAGITA